MDKMTKRFALYLKDVIDYYKANGSLRNFSKISKKHKITKLPQELFFKFGLDRFPNGAIPNEKLCKDILGVIRERNRFSKLKSIAVDETARFKDGEVIAWMHPNGLKSIACVTNDDWAFQTLNMRGREDEKDRLWVQDCIPSDVINGMYPLVEPTVEELKYFAYLVCKEFDRYIENESKKQKSLFE